MSTYEKIATTAITVSVVVMVIFSYHEYKEPQEQESGPRPNFNTSVGKNFIIGSFSTLLSQQSSGGFESNCTTLQPVTIGVLHDIKEHLEHQKPYAGVEDPFEVNPVALQLLCNKDAEVVLTDAVGNKLLLHKVPFVRTMMPDGDAATEVHIDATVIPRGGVAPLSPTTFGDLSIPDRFLDATTSQR